VRKNTQDQPGVEDGKQKHHTGLPGAEKQEDATKSKAKKKKINPKNPEPPGGISSEVFNPKHPALPTGIVQSRCRSVPKHPTKESKNPK
jgi:hypothetical protein